MAQVNWSEAVQLVWLSSESQPSLHWDKCFIDCVIEIWDYFCSWLSSVTWTKNLRCHFPLASMWHTEGAGYWRHCWSRSPKALSASTSPWQQWHCLAGGTDMLRIIASSFSKWGTSASHGPGFLFLFQKTCMSLSTHISSHLSTARRTSCRQLSSVAAWARGRRENRLNLTNAHHMYLCLSSLAEGTCWTGVLSGEHPPPHTIPVKTWTEIFYFTLVLSRLFTVAKF